MKKTLKNLVLSVILFAFVAAYALTMPFGVLKAYEVDNVEVEGYPHTTFNMSIPGNRQVEVYHYQQELPSEDIDWWNNYCQSICVVS